MSANNFYYAKEIDGKWYGWDEMAEESMTDSEHGHKRTLHLVRAVEADSLHELEQKLNDKGLGYSEYGITTQPYLPKDGTPIEVVI